MNNDNPTHPIHTSADPDDAQRLIARAARQSVRLDTTSAKMLASLGPLTSNRKLDGACRLIRAARDKDVILSFRGALQRIEMYGGNAEEAIRRFLAARRAEIREEASEMIRYAADRGIVFAPGSVDRLFRTRSRDGTRDYVDKLSTIMDAASLLGVNCTQTLATRRLSLAEGDARRVIAHFAAERRRRSDRLTITCRTAVPPRTFSDRANAFAGCGCQRCRNRLADQMQRYIGKLITIPLCQGLDREEARAEANLELIEAIETWPGGNFTGWFATGFIHRVQGLYSARSAEERAALSLDAQDVLSDDEGGRIVPLGERIPDRSVDVLIIVLLRERLAEETLQLRQIRADRSEAYANHLHASCESAISPRSTLLAKRPTGSRTPPRRRTGSRCYASPSSAQRRPGHTVHFERCSKSDQVDPSRGGAGKP